MGGVLGQPCLDWIKDRAPQMLAGVAFVPIPLWIEYD